MTFVPEESRARFSPFRPFFSTSARHLFFLPPFVVLVVVSFSSCRRPYAIRGTPSRAFVMYLCAYSPICREIPASCRLSRLLTTPFRARSLNVDPEVMCVYSAYTRVLIRFYTRTLCYRRATLKHCLLSFVSVFFT